MTTKTYFTFLTNILNGSITFLNLIYYILSGDSVLFQRKNIKHLNHNKSEIHYSPLIDSIS